MVRGDIGDQNIVLPFSQGRVDVLELDQLRKQGLGRKKIAKRLNLGIGTVMLEAKRRVPTELA